MSNKKGRYGSLTVFAFIIASVIGTGIFFKGDSVMNLTHSAQLTTLVWIVMSVVSFCLAFAFVEVTSSTTVGETNEQGNLTNWSSKFYNRRFGTFVGIFTLYFYIPTTLVALAIIGSRLLMKMFFSVDQLAVINENVHDQHLFAIGITLIVIVSFIFFLVINTFSTKFSSVFSIVGTFFKIGTLLFVIVAMIMWLLGWKDGTGNGNWSSSGGVPDGNAAAGESSWIGFFLAMPAATFAFDGFVFAGTLQDETKEKKTFSSSLISSVVVILVLYFFLIVLSTAVGGQNGSNYSVSGIIVMMFGDSEWIRLGMLFLIVLSAFSGMNSFLVFGIRMYADMSNTKQLPDKDGSIARETEKGTYMGACKWMAIIIAIYVLIFIVGDTLLFPWVGSQSGTGIVQVEEYYGNAMISATDVITMLMFVVYSVILIGAIKNRRTKKVHVNKQKGFLFYSYTASIIILFTVLVYFISLPFGYFNDTISKDDANFGSYYSIGYDAIFFVIMAIIYAAFNKALGGIPEITPIFDKESIAATMRFAVLDTVDQDRKEWSVKTSKVDKLKFHELEGTSFVSKSGDRKLTGNIDDKLESVIVIYKGDEKVVPPEHIKYENLDQVPYLTSYDYTKEVASKENKDVKPTSSTIKK